MKKILPILALLTLNLILAACGASGPFPHELETAKTEPGFVGAWFHAPPSNRYTGESFTRSQANAAIGNFGRDFVFVDYAYVGSSSPFSLHHVMQGEGGCVRWIAYVPNPETAKILVNTVASDCLPVAIYAGVDEDNLHERQPMKQAKRISAIMNTIANAGLEIGVYAAGTSVQFDGFNRYYFDWDYYFSLREALPPHPLSRGFSLNLGGLSSEELLAVLERVCDTTKVTISYARGNEVFSLFKTPSNEFFGQLAYKHSCVDGVSVWSLNKVEMPSFEISQNAHLLNPDGSPTKNGREWAQYLYSQQ